VHEIANEKVKNCTQGQLIKAEVEGMKKTILAFQDVDTKIFDKIDESNKEHRGRWFWFFGVLITQSLALLGGMFMIILKLKGL